MLHMLRYVLLLAALVSLPALAAPTTDAPNASSAPAALQYLLKQGLKVHTHFSTPGDMTGYIGTIPGGKKVVFYIPEDGSVAIFGTMLNADGRNLSKLYLTQYKRGPLAAKNYKKLKNTHWIAMGDMTPERIVYAFIDPNCPYCWHLWTTARKYYDQGLQMRYIVVAILGQSSLNKAAAILAADNPKHALKVNETGFENHSGAIEPMEKIPDDLRAKIVANNELMLQFGFNGTPAMVWKNDKGAVMTQNGLLPERYLKVAFGVAESPTQKE